MPDPNVDPPRPEKPREPFDAQMAVLNALIDSINTQHVDALMRPSPRGVPELKLTLRDTAKNALTAALMAETQRQLCNAGVLTTLTCSTSPGRAYYYFDFNLSAPKRGIGIDVYSDPSRSEYLMQKSSGRYIGVGITMDSERMEYYLRKAISIFD
jgi:hypothetical protein